jgi:hypothetical protein
MEILTDRLHVESVSRVVQEVGGADGQQDCDVRDDRLAEEGGPDEGDVGQEWNIPNGYRGTRRLAHVARTQGAGDSLGDQDERDADDDHVGAEHDGDHAEDQREDRTGDARHQESDDP